MGRGGGTTATGPLDPPAVGEDVQPLNVGAVPPRAIVPDVLLDQVAQCVEPEVFGLCFAWRQSCAEPMRSSAKWALPQVRDARASEPVQLLGAAAAEVMPTERSAVFVVHLPADSPRVSRLRM